MRFTPKRLAVVAEILAVIGAAAVVADAWSRFVRFIEVPEVHNECLHGLGALAGGAMLGAVARGLRCFGWRRAASALHILVAACAIGLLWSWLAMLVERFGSPHWSLTFARVVQPGLPLALSLVALTWKRRLAMFAVGAALVTVMCWWYTTPAGTVAVLAFIFARDVGAIDDEVPARQTLALAGLGALSMMLAFGLAFDLKVTVAHDDAASWGREIYLDEAFVRWPRIALEAAMIAGCCAHARGRSWGVVAVLVLGLGFLGQLAATDFDLPFTGTCAVTTHPLEAVPFVLALGLAVVPYVVPLARALRASPALSLK